MSQRLRRNPITGKLDLVINEDLYTLRSHWLQNGFQDASEVDLSWDDGTRTLTIQPSASSFSYFLDGILYTETGSITEIIADTEGLWLFYIDAEGSMASINSPSEAQIDGVIEDECIVAFVYWDATNNDGRLLSELHGSRMNPATHHWIHDNIGAVYKSGMALSDFVIDDDGNDDEDAQFSVGSGAFYDDDIEHAISAVTKTTGLEIWYLIGSDWRWTANAGFSVLTAGTGRIAYNDSGSQTEVANNRFALCHVFATNITADDGTSPKYIAIQGQAEYTNVSAARAGAETEINSLVYGSLPLPEIVPIATVIFQTSNNYGNSVKGRTRTTDAGDNYVDWRGAGLKATGGSIADHGSLSGLADDDHQQYSLVDGTRAFTGVVAGITPVADADLATKGYVDGAGSGLILPRGYIDGLILSNDTDADHDISVSIGACRSIANNSNIVNASALVKQIDAAWAAGTAAGGMFTGSVAADTWYHFHSIVKDADSSIDFGFDTSVTAANIPAGYTEYRRLGSVLTDGSSNILAFVQYGDYVIWVDPPQDVGVTNLGLTQVFYTVSVPPDLNFVGLFGMRLTKAASRPGFYSAMPGALDETVAGAPARITIFDSIANSQSTAQGPKYILTNTSSQIPAVSNFASTTFAVTTFGYIDARGKNA